MLSLFKYFKDYSFWDDYLMAITNPRIMTEGFWYRMPVNKDKEDFIIHYAKASGFIEFSSKGLHYRVIGFPESKIERKRLYSDPDKKNIEFVDTSTITIRKDNVKVHKTMYVPGVCSRPDLAIKILSDLGISPSDYLVKLNKEYLSVSEKPFVDDF